VSDGRPDELRLAAERVKRMVRVLREPPPADLAPDLAACELLADFALTFIGAHEQAAKGGARAVRRAPPEPQPSPPTVSDAERRWRDRIVVNELVDRIVITVPASPSGRLVAKALKIAERDGCTLAEALDQADRE
jgi:hypothetical protein